jgi:CheY-like chemotaxis protein
MSNAEPVTILLVEDNPDHATLTLRALRKGNLINDVAWVRDGAEALDFLYRRGAYADPPAPRPGLILLDLKLPKVDGHGVLRHIKSDAELRNIPVVMLTTSSQPEDVNGSYGAGANSFITKPVSFVDFMEKINAVRLYWMLTNVPPGAALS